MLFVHIIIATGKSAPLMIDRTESICCVKNRIKEKWSKRGFPAFLPAFDFDLFYQGEKLVDNQTVHECCIEEFGDILIWRKPEPTDYTA